MSAALHVKHEPLDRDAPVNGTLDALETLIRVIIANGGEPALRARMARLLPADAPPPSASLPAFAPDPLDVSKVVAVCRTLSGFKLTAETHASLAVMRRMCVDYLAAVNGGVRP